MFGQICNKRNSIVKMRFSDAALVTQTIFKVFDKLLDDDFKDDSILYDEMENDRCLREKILCLYQSSINLSFQENFKPACQRAVNFCYL